MKRLLFYILCSFFSLSLFAQVEQTEVLLLMGSRFEITVVANDANQARDGIALAKAEIQGIEALISSWNDDSQTSQINANAGKQTVVVDFELYSLIERCKGISELTRGAFDISAVVVNRIWKFDGSMKALPSPDEVSHLKPLINYKNIILNPQDTSVFLQSKGMSIGFGSIGKGYAAQQAAILLQENGVTSGLINAGGDLYAWGHQANGDNWQVAITDPKNKEQAKSWLSIENQAIVTSGDYEKRVRFEDKYYSHIIDPRTALPVENNLKSVSVLASNAELADALATALFVLGSEIGLYLVNQLPQVEALFITAEGEIIYSDKIELNSIDT